MWNGSTPHSQREIVDSNMELGETKAGKTMNKAIDELTLNFRHEKDKLDTRFHEASTLRQEQHNPELATIKADCERRIFEAKRSQEKVEVDFYKLLEETLHEREYMLYIVTRKLEDTNQFRMRELENVHFGRKISGFGGKFETELEYNGSRLTELDGRIEYLKTQGGGGNGDLPFASKDRERVRRVYEEFLAQSEKRSRQSELILRGEENSLRKIQLALEGFGVLMRVRMTDTGAATGIPPLIGDGLSLASNSIRSIRRKSA